jgi:hypothetical protein
VKTFSVKTFKVNIFRVKTDATTCRKSHFTGITHSTRPLHRAR